MNFYVFHVHKCRVTDLIIYIRMFFHSKARRQSQEKGENIRRVKTAVQIPLGGAAHSLPRKTLLISDFFFFFFCIITVTLCPCHMQGLMILLFFPTAVICSNKLYFLKSIPPTPFIPPFTYHYCIASVHYISSKHCHRAHSSSLKGVRSLPEI